MFGTNKIRSKIKSKAVLILAALFVCSRVNAQIIINEVMTKNENSTKSEYVELYNESSETVILDKYVLKKKTASGSESSLLAGSKFLGVIKPHGYFVIAHPDYAFEINADAVYSSASYSIADDNTVLLYDSGGKLVDKVGFGNAKDFFESAVNNPDESKSIGRIGFLNSKNNGKDFVFNVPTPGKENVLYVESAPVKIASDGELAGGVEVDDDIYTNVYANFAINGLSKDIKITWEFGDGHKSYLQCTRHKYEKEGTYHVSLKRTGSENFIKEFDIEVESIPHPKIKIIAFMPNPKGKDSGEEFLTVANKSKKKINLKGWSIATGWKKKMINHPIREDFILKKGKAKDITSEFSSFTLNNTKARIQLRYPDGKIAQDFVYKKPEGIKDGEKRVKVKGGWEWITSVESQKLKVESSDEEKDTITKIQDTGNIQNSISNIQADENDLQTKTAQENTPTEKVEIEMLKNNYSKIELLQNPHVLETEDLREENEQYFFTQKTKDEDHYAVIFWKNLRSTLNEKINTVVNLF